MLKILGLVTFKVYPAEMGGQKGVADFYTHLSRHHEVVLAVSSDNRSGDKNVHPDLFSNRRIANNFFRLSRLIKLAKREKANIIISEHSYPGWVALLLSKSLRIPFIIHSHNIEALRFKKMDRRWWRVYWQYEKWIHRKAHHSFFISKEDEEFAITHFEVDPAKCSVVTYGIKDPLPFFSRPESAENIFLFNGSLDYQPNAEAVIDLIEKINPVLRTKLNNYRIVITGKGASQDLVERITAEPEMQFLGFVEDLQPLLQKATLFINPVLNDTGVKTKVVEAIGQHCTVVSTGSGASGLEKSLCGNKLKVVPDADWESFASAIAATTNEAVTPTPEEYFHFYSWKTIASSAAKTIARVVDSYHLRQYN